MKTKLSFFVVIFFATIPLLFSQSHNYESLTITKSGYNYLFEFNLSDFILDTIEIDKGNGITEDFIKILLDDDDYGYIDSIGIPELPHFTFMFAIPYNEIIPNIATSNITTDSKYNNFRIIPSQEYQSTDPEEPQPPFYINESYYSTNGINYSPVSITDEYILSGVKGIRITVCPFYYNPSQKTLEVRNNINFEVQLEGEITTNHAPSYIIEKFFETIFVNNIQIYSTKSYTKGNYLMITAPEYETNLTYFANYKRNIGFNVTLVNTNITGTTKENIKNYIQTRYNNISTRPVFVLLVGDTDKIPCWEGEHSKKPKTDLYYATLEGNDRVPDVFIGRFSVRNESELHNIINKTIYMETNLHNIEKKAVFLADDGSGSKWFFQTAHNAVIKKAFDKMNYTSLKLYVNDGATSNDAINAINNNQTFLIYSGHSNYYNLSGPYINRINLTNLSNTVYPFAFAFSCLSNAFEKDECFGETWIRVKHGGVAYYGASHTTIMHVDRPFEKKLFINAWYKDNNEQLGPITKTGMERLCNNLWSVNYRKKYREMYNLMGDPSLTTAGIGCISDYIFVNTEIFYSGADITYHSSNNIVAAEGNSTFVVESGANVTLKAGNSITLKPGFTAKAGSNFTASIEPCVKIDTNKSLLVDNPNNSENTKKEKETKQFIVNKTKQFVKAYPNPFENQTTIEFVLEEHNIVVVEAYNLLGAKIFQNVFFDTHIGINSKIVDFSIFESGIFIIKVQSKEFNEVLFLYKHK
jgi:hypothetical protein